MLKWPRLELLDEDTPVESPAAPENLTRNYTAEAIRVLQAQSEQLFFLYLAHTMPHPPRCGRQVFFSDTRKP